MECQAEIFKRKVIQLTYEMDANFGDSGEIIVFPDGSHIYRHIILDDFNAPEMFQEIHPPYCIEYQEATVREYVTE